VNLKHKGFTLIEVMIALVLFGVFSLSYITGHIANISDSTTFKTNLRLRDLAQMKINEVIVNPPELSEALTSGGIEKAKFDDFPEYEYELEFKAVFIPEFDKIMGKKEDEDSSKASIQKRVFAVVKENMEKLVWQVRVLVRHLDSGETYELTSWLNNEKAKVVIKGF
jgi:prepilin-type N-terminal cleavage/methylation domain-containing protein